MAADVCRWGILGTAGIARKNWQAIALAGNASLSAVAGRSLERSRQFIAECLASCPLPQAPPRSVATASCCAAKTSTPSTSRCRPVSARSG